MKKEKKTPVESVEATAAPVDAQPVATPEAPKARKGVSRLCALITLVACALVAFLVPLTVFKSGYIAESKTMVETFKSLFGDGSTAKLFGFLPAAFADSGFAAIVANLLPYLFALLAAIAVILCLIAAFAGKRGMVKTSVILVLIGALLVFGGVFYVSKAKMAKPIVDINALIVAGVALVWFILVCIFTKKRKVKEVELPKEDPFKDFHTEEVIEAYAYDGGPVAGIEIAEEVYPTVAAIEAKKDPDGAARNTVASLLGNGFDAFLITLSEKEKNEFIDLYVLKCKGIMPEIPGYVVGGDNKDFFNKVFIYLGQYREKIPGDLLAKMYSFSMKI